MTIEKNNQQFQTSKPLYTRGTEWRSVWSFIEEAIADYTPVYVIVAKRDVERLHNFADLHRCTITKERDGYTLQKRTPVQSFSK